MNTIRQGRDYHFTLTIRDGDGGAFSLAGCTITVTVSNAVTGVTVLTQTLQVDMFGVVVIADGLAMVGLATDGVIEQTVTAAQTTAFPLGTLYWEAVVLDSTGDTNTVNWGEWLVTGVSFVDAGTSRAELRRYIADAVGDLRQLVTTDVGDTSHIIDALNISGAENTYNGGMLTVMTGPNRGHIARITDTSTTANRITFTPAAPTAFAIGDEIDVVNDRSRGWTIQDYNRVINRVIDQVYPLSVAKIYYDYPTDFDIETPVLTVPEQFIEVFEVGWLNATTNAYSPINAGRYSGWQVQGNDLVLIGRGARFADQRFLRIRGYARHQTLQSDTDQTRIHTPYLVSRAAAELMRNGVAKEQARGNLILLHTQEADRLKTTIHVPRHPDTQQLARA